MKQKTTNRTMRVMTGTLALAVMLSGFATFNAGARLLDDIGAIGAGADCEGDPCADTSCSCNDSSCSKSGTASAHAVGSEKAYARATVGEWEKKQDQPGTAHAAMTGTASPDAKAKGKKDWSLKEANSNCNGPENDAGAAFLDELVNIETGMETFAFSLRCIADDRIRESVSFVGRLHASASGAGALVGADGMGLVLDGFEMTFHGETFDALVPIDLTVFYPTSMQIAVEIVDNGDVDGCSAKRV